MLPMHLVVGLALGWVPIRGRGIAWVVAAAAVVVSLVWGLLVAFNTDDTDALPAFAGGTGIAFANVVVGYAIGAGVSFGWRAIISRVDA